MNDKQIVEYVRNMIIVNLNQYIQNKTGDVRLLMSEIYNLENDENNETLLGHIKGVKELLEKAEKIIESEK